MELLSLIAGKAEKEGLSFLVVGGHAINAYGFGRQTGDLDLAVREEQKEKWKQLLLQLGYKLYHEQLVFMQFTAPLVGVWPVDLMFLNQKTFDQLFADSREVSFGGATRVNVPSVEHLIAMKLHALKGGAKKRRLKDLADIVALIELKEYDIVKEGFRNLCLKHATIEIYEEICKELLRRANDG